MANTQRRARPKWVTSQIQILFGSQTSQWGHGVLGRRGVGGCSGSTSPWAARTRRNVEGATHTRPT